MSKQIPLLTRATYRFIDPYGRIFLNPDFPFEQFISAWKVDEHLRPDLFQNFHRWHRILMSARHLQGRLRGPTLDVASGDGVLYPAFKNLLPNVLPYTVAEMRTDGTDLLISGDRIQRLQFECDKELIPADDAQYGFVTFLDVLEHLLVDPMWTILEFNRVLQLGGHLMISTPNAGCFERGLSIFTGHNPASESEYKPTSPYQRHNREWTPHEVSSCLTAAGFEVVFFETFPDLFPSDFNELYANLTKLIADVVPPHLLGPEIIIVARKVSEKNLSGPLTDSERWPPQIYSPHEHYHRRPTVYPIVWGSDYG